MVLAKPRPEPAALAFSYSEPGQSHCWAVTNGLAWPGPNRLGLAWLLALGRAGHITRHIFSYPIDIGTDGMLELYNEVVTQSAETQRG